MKKIEEMLVNAIKHKKNFTRSNVGLVVRYTKVEQITTIRMYGNEICTVNWYNRTLVIDHCGWITQSTKSRLNAILSVFGIGVSIYQKQGQFYFDGGSVHNCPFIKSVTLSF